MAAIGGFLAVDLGAVAYAGGWIGTAHRLTPHIFIKAFEWVNGKQSGFRKNHAKGVAVAGYFDSNGNGREVSSAAVFRSGRTPGVGPILAGGGQRARRRYGSDGTGPRPGVRVSWGRAMAHRDAESSCFPRHRQARPGGHGSIPCRTSGDGESHEDHRSESAYSRLCGQHLPQPQHVLLHQRVRLPNPGPVVAGAGHAPAAPTIVRAQCTVRRCCPPDPFRPPALEVDAHSRRSSTPSRSSAPLHGSA